MSKKINVLSIINGHCSSLKNSDGTFNFYDFMTFLIIPLCLSSIAAFFIKSMSDPTISLLVNFGSIFTALLLSVLVLIFDQENKADEQYEKHLLFKEEIEKNPGLNNSPAYTWIFSRNLDENYPDKKVLLKQLYFNISFSIIISLFLVLLCLIYSNLEVIKNLTLLLVIKKVMIFLTVFSMLTIFLNILMIVKRMHVMLTA